VPVNQINQTRVHWIQHITFTAETNAADTHTHSMTGWRSPSNTIPPRLAKRRRR